MQNIGLKIREYRRKNDLTQEKLADYLNVSYQAVSKWETGTANPDLSLIGPLTRLFHVTADELLGLDNHTAESDRHMELHKMHEDTYVTGDLDERYRVAVTANEEFPENLEYIEWLASAEYFIAFDEDYNSGRSDAHFKTMMEKARRHYELVIEECTGGTEHDEKIRNSALSGIVMALHFLGHLEEGIPYAEQYPEQRTYTRDDVMEWCLTGDKLTEHKQKRIRRALGDLCMSLSFYGTDEAIDAWEKVINAVVTDGNYVEFIDDLYGIKIAQMKRHLRNGAFDDAIEALRDARYYAEEHDRMFYGDETYFDEPKVYRYTTPLLNRYSRDMRDRCVSGTETHTEEFYRMLTYSWLDPLRSHPKFAELCEK